MKIAIVGGGIGGLTTALALKQNGQDVTIYESASEIKPVGAGILLAINAMQVYKNLGIHKKIEKAGAIVSNIQTTDAQLNTISETKLSHFENKYGVCSVAIHRADLHTILADEIGWENIKLSKRLINIEEGNEFKLHFEDGSSINCDVLIGADGIKSVVRKQLFNEGTFRDTKQRCWRGVCEFDSTAKYNQIAIESWGKGKRFGFVEIGKNKVYWYAVIKDTMMKENYDLADLFNEFHPEIVKIINKTPKDNIIFSDIKDLQPINQWQKGKVCLVGDAAHATTPNMGQGACQAIEDAYVIGKLFGQEKSVEAVFTQYEKLRLEKAHYIINTSWTIGKVAHYENSIAIWVRNFLVKNTPINIVEKQLNKVFSIEYNIV